MASNLAGDICIGAHSVCLLRAAELNPDCSPVGGEDSGVVTPGIVTLTATPERAEDFNLEPENGCGETLFTYNKPGKLLRYTVTGEIGYHDWEMYTILFGGELILGGASGPYEGEVIGWASGDQAPLSYLEIFEMTAGAEVGECATEEGGFPPMQSQIFGKCRFTTDATTYGRQERFVSFTGTAEGNPNLGLGPWEDWPGDGVVRGSVGQHVGYSAAQYQAILATAKCGFQTLPVPES